MKQLGKGDCVDLYELHAGNDCPVCGKMLPDPDYCPHCGEALKSQQEAYHDDYT